MPLRITNNLKTQSATGNIFRISEQLNKTQEKLVTGKRINRPSDDPNGARQIMNYRKDAATQAQYIRNAEYSTNFLRQTDSVVSSLQNITDAARSLGVQQANFLPNQAQRSSAASQISLWINEAVSLANSKFGSRYVLGGQSTAESPIRQTGSEINYVGDNAEVQVEVNDGNMVGLNLAGSSVFAADLNADINTNTLISGFHHGNGAPAGQFSITNRLGNFGTIAIGANFTVGDVINSINSSGLGVSASINSAGDGISVTDNNANPTGNLVVQDIGTGTTARELGVIGNAAQTIQGIKAQPAITASTPLSLLKGGSGITLSDVRVVNGAASGVVTFGNASTVQDILNAFNNAGLNLNATINGAGNGLKLASTTGASIPVVLDAGTGTTASDLGLGGANSLFSTLTSLRDAFANNDIRAVSALVENLGVISENLSNVRGTIGARVNMVNSNVESLSVNKENSTQAVALTENDDFAASATQLAALETALNASLSTTARILPPTLVDFLR